MVADALVYHPVMSHWLKYFATAVGRDKILRTLQYFSRFYAWYLYRTNAPEAAIKPFAQVKKQFGLTRKILRVGKFVEHFKAASVAIDAKGMDPVMKYLAVGRQLGYAGYMLFDNANVLDSAGIRKNPYSKTFSQQAVKAWFSGLVFSALTGIYTLYSVQQRSAALNKEEGESAVQSKKLAAESRKATLQLIQDLCDLCNPGTQLGFVNFDDGVIGLAGTVSSLLGVYSTWKKTA